MARAVQSMYGQSILYTVGHSLGGALASLTGNTLGITAIGFNSPPDRLVTESLSLNPNSDNVYHFGNNGDAIFVGECNAVRPPFISFNLIECIPRQHLHSLRHLDRHNMSRWKSLLLQLHWDSFGPSLPSNYHFYQASQ